MIQSIKERIRRETSGPSLPLIGFSVALNLTVGQITGVLKIPVYLDSLGTVLTAVVSGPWAAVIAGCLSNLLAAALGNPTMMFFLPPMIAIGIFTGLVARAGWFRRSHLCVLGGVLQGLLAALLSAPISAHLFAGTTMGGADFLVVYFRSRDYSIFESVLFQGLLMDPVDKVITYLLVFSLLRGLPERLMNRFPGAANVLGGKG
ncbi:MAG: ECF transporter S component [Ignavibacteriales bacterium]|nr:ECF transporter S component [Ignavibacteriales bacterium]